MDLSWTVLATYYPPPDLNPIGFWSVTSLMAGSLLAYLCSKWSFFPIKVKQKIMAVSPMFLIVATFLQLMTDSRGSAGMADWLAMLIPSAFAFGLALACRYQPVKWIQATGIIHTSVAGFLPCVVAIDSFFYWASHWSIWGSKIHDLFPDSFLKLVLYWAPCWLILWLPFSIWLARRGYRNAVRQIAGRYCLKCEYDLRGSTHNNACPESGEPIPWHLAKEAT